MSLSFSCICLTAGRAELLEEAIAAFLGQVCAPDAELLVINTLPAQQLELVQPCSNVRIINLPERPASLGEARNLAIHLAKGKWCVTWDDDDQYLANHLSNFLAQAEAGSGWLWQTRQFYMLSNQIKSVVPGSANVLAFTKKAWGHVGGYKRMNCGEDREFVQRVTSQYEGKRIELADDKISFIYAWGQGVYHQSGMGDDQPGQLTSWQRGQLDLRRKIEKGAIPTGIIRLEPKLQRNYQAMARAFIARNGPIRLIDVTRHVELKNGGGDGVGGEAPRLIHAVELHSERMDPRKRNAQASWKALYAQGVVPCHLIHYPRSSRTLGDGRGLPYLKDVLNHAMNHAHENDVIFLTNDDTWLHPKLPPVLLRHVLTFGPVSSQRCEFVHRPILPASASPQQFAVLSERHPGRDLFGFTFKWLQKRWPDIPDMLLGASEWDTMLAALIRLDYGVLTNTKNIQDSIPPCELERGYVAHQYHPPVWQRADILNKSPSQLHNRKLMLAFVTKYKLPIWFGPFLAPLWNRDTAPVPLPKPLPTLKKSQA